MVSIRGGHGKSDIGTMEPSYELKANDLKADLSELHITKTAIIGFSDGAYTDYRFAADYSQSLNN